MPIISGPAGMDPILGRMRTKDIQGGTASGNYTFNSVEFTVGAAGLVSLNQVPSSKLDTTMDIVNVTGTSVTLQPNTAYKIYATSQAITLNANPPAAGKWAYEGHLEIFVAGTGYVVTGANVVLANALEPDSVNNCTVRFHDGIAIIAVEDHVAGYIVVNGSTAGSGSLYYGIATSTNDYVAFDASLNGTTIPLAGAVSEGEKHVVGNGYTETAITGAVDCGTSKFTVANLALSDVQIVGGVMTLGDAYIPSGSTVAVSGGSLAVEKVTGNDGTIMLGVNNRIKTGAANANMNHIKITGFTGSGGYGTDGMYAAVSKEYGGVLNMSGCVISGNTGSYRGTALSVVFGGSATLIDCTIEDNTKSIIDAHPSACTLIRQATLNLSGCTIGSGQTLALIGGSDGSGAHLNLNGSNRIEDFVYGLESNCYVNIASGAIVDLTGNSEPTPIAPGGGITFEPGGATVYPSAGQASAYMLGGMTVPQIGNTNVVNLGGLNVVISSGTTASASGCTFTSGGSSTSSGGAFFLNSNCSLVLSNCTMSGNVASKGGAVDATYGGLTTRIDVYGGIISGNTAAATSRGFDIFTQGELNIFGATVGKITCVNGAMVNISGTVANDYINVAGAGQSATVTISSGASINLTSSINPGGTGGIQVVGGTCTVNGNVIESGTYTSIDSNGSATV